MKKLSNKQLEQIKAGSITGALLSGIGSILKASFEGVSSMINSIGGMIFAGREFNKGHAKMAAKFGNVSLQYDDTPIIKAEEELAEQKMKQEKNTVSKENQIKLIGIENKPALDWNENEHSALIHDDDFSNIYDSSMNLVDDFMHF